MYFSELNGLDFIRAHAGMSSLSLINGHNPGTSMGVGLPVRDLHRPLLSISPPKKSPSRSQSSPSPGSAAASLPSTGMSSTLSAIDLIQFSKIGGLKEPEFNSPPHATSNPEHNICKLIDYRGAQVATFLVDNRDLICLPQAFELFLKHLVGGLHTVYTKLKRLDITPVVCNVEQVRILRGLGAIQPGVNRCKLISCAEFDMLYEDCTNPNARPGRPAKRVHSSDLVSTDIVEKFKRHKMGISNEYPYGHRLYDRQSLVGNFMSAGYQAIPQFSNLLSMHHFLPQLGVPPLVDHRLDSAGKKPDRTDRTVAASDTESSRSRDERLMLGIYRRPQSPITRTFNCRAVDDSKFALSMEMSDHHRTDKSEQSGSDNECDVDDEKATESDERDENIDTSCDSEVCNTSIVHCDPRPLSHLGSISSTSGGSELSGFESLVAKFNMIVRSLVDAAKSVERRAGEEKNQISFQLVREKERCLELEKEMQDEKRKREFFQRRARQLKEALRCDRQQQQSDRLQEREEILISVATSDNNSFNFEDVVPVETPTYRIETLMSPHRTTPTFGHQSLPFPKVKSAEI